MHLPKKRTCRFQMPRFESYSVDPVAFMKMAVFSKASVHPNGSNVAS
jgi:hypothetical protein